MLATLVVLGGCMTAGNRPGKVSLNMIEGAYEAPKSTALPNDIKTILAAGGLDVANPSAPVDGTKVAELATNAKSQKVQGLVAKLEGPEKETQPGSGTGDGAALLSLVAPDRKAPPTDPQVSTVTFTYPEISAGASVKQPARPEARPAARKPPAKAGRVAKALPPKDSSSHVRRF